MIPKPFLFLLGRAAPQDGFSLTNHHVLPMDIFFLPGCYYFLGREVNAFTWTTPLTISNLQWLLDERVGSVPQWRAGPLGICRNTVSHCIPGG